MKLEYNKKAFTLIELLVVIAIMGILLGMTMVAFHKQLKNTGMRAGQLNLKSAAVGARQHAITQRKRVYFAYGNDTEENRGYYFATNKETGFITETNYLPMGIVFAGDDNWTEIPPGADPSNLVFKSDGTLADAMNILGTGSQFFFYLMEKDAGTNGLMGVLKVYGLTGMVRIMDYQL